MHVRSPFPPEIVDAVIDELHDDSDALKHCSLVSNEFRLRSQMHLYSRITIEFTGPIHHRHPARPFVTILTPRLGHCIRHLTLLNYVQQWWDHYNDDFFKNEDYILPLLFKQLHRLHSFRLISDGKIMGFGTRRLSPLLQSAVVAMIQKTQVAELTVQDFFDFPMVSLAFTCPHLKALSFRRDDSNVTVAEKLLLVPPGIEIEDKAHLDALELDDRAVISIDILYRMTKLPQARLTLSYLRDLSIIGYEPCIMACVSKIVSDAASTLERLTWDYDDCIPINNFIPGSVLPAFPNNLISLHLAFTHCRNDEPLHLTWILNGLQQISTSGRLEELVLFLSMRRRSNGGTETSPWSVCDTWAPSFDSLLAGPRYPNLRRVAIFVNYETIYFRHVVNSHLFCLSLSTSAAAQLKQKLPLLSDKGILSVQPVVSGNDYPQPLTFMVPLMEQGLRGDVFYWE